MKELEIGAKYLIKSHLSYYATIYKVKVAEKSDTCYCLLYEEGRKQWITKNRFHSEYDIVEKLDELQQILGQCKD